MNIQDLAEKTCAEALAKGAREVAVGTGHSRFIELQFSSVRQDHI